MENLKIINAIKSLPRHQFREWMTRGVFDINKVIVHQSASSSGKFAVAKYHITPTSDRNNDGIISGWERNHISDRGCPAICYHYGIETDGEIYLMNNLIDVTWHAKNYNYESVGIVIFCNASGVSWEGTRESTESQLVSLLKLLTYLKNKELKDNNLKYSDFLGHCEVDPINKINCPGNLIMSKLQEWRDNDGI